MKTNTQMIQEMLALQDSMNKKVHPEWHTQGWNWYRAIWLETAEAVEHMPWKWWKKSEPNEEQVKLEVVDIWHFILSLSIVEGITNELECMYSLPNFSGPTFQADRLTTRLESLAEAALTGDNAAIAMRFLSVLNFSGMTLEQLYSLYLGKNILNRFRQDFGYKDGTYKKLWNGVEDNKVLVEVMEKLDAGSITYASDVYYALEEIYTEAV